MRGCPDNFHELQIHDPETLDFDNKPDFALMALYKLITAATEHMKQVDPYFDHMLFVRLPIVNGGLK